MSMESITKEGASQLLDSFEARLCDIRKSRKEIIERLKKERTNQLFTSLERLNKHYDYYYSIAKRLKKVLSIFQTIKENEEKSRQKAIFNTLHENQLVSLSEQIFAALERNIA